MLKLTKTGILTLTALLGLTGVATASPLKTYDQGKVAVSAGYTAPTGLDYSEHANPSKKASFYGGATVGLGKKTAVNYKYQNFKADQNNDLTSQEVNLMYQFLPQLTGYAGYVNSRAEVYGANHSSGSGQIGLQARVEVPLLCTVWGTAAYGTKVNSWEVGVSRALVNNLELDLSYYNNKFKDLDQGGDATAKGIRMGLTLKF